MKRHVLCAAHRARKELGDDGQQRRAQRHHHRDKREAVRQEPCRPGEESREGDVVMWVINSELGVRAGCAARVAAVANVLVCQSVCGHVSMSCRVRLAIECVQSAYEVYMLRDDGWSSSGWRACKSVRQVDFTWKHQENRKTFKE